MTTRSVTSKEQAERLAAYLVNLPLPFTLTVKEGKVRTLDQNALLHKWFGEISAQRGDISASEAKGECHHKYGVVIKARDSQWLFIWRAVQADLRRREIPINKTLYEIECGVLASGNLNVSSSMTTKELSEYMDAMHRDYAAQGVNLTLPEAQ